MGLAVVGGLLVLVAACGEPDNGAQTESATSSTDGAGNNDSAALEQTPPINGKEIYQNFCFSCHTPGLSGAPKLGDSEAWAPRIAKGKALLLQSTIDGMPPAMPPRGICMSCSDEELAAAIDYMIGESQ